MSSAAATSFRAKPSTSRAAKSASPANNRPIPGWISRPVATPTAFRPRSPSRDRPASPRSASPPPPALPEEELLSRLLFGSSITQISAPEAVQLAAAVASLRGGSGLDPINKLRSAIGLDRLRVIGADATIGRGTSIAVGKYLGRKFFIELVTDGKGYSASSIEFRITRWLSLLGTISSLSQQSGLNVKASKDY